MPQIFEATLHDCIVVSGSIPGSRAGVVRVETVSLFEDIFRRVCRFAEMGSARRASSKLVPFWRNAAAWNRQTCPCSFLFPLW